MGALVELLRAALPGRDVPDELEPALAAATAAWPGVHVEPERFARAIAARLAEGPVADALGALAVADLYLACGCADGDPAALAAFDAQCGPTIDRAVAQSGVPAADRADIAQIVRGRLLVAASPEQPARIATYSARGALAAWVRVVAVREATRALPRALREPQAEDDELGTLLAREDDPELAYLKRTYREELKRAFAVAVEALDARERLILRQHTIDGLGIDQLAGLHQVHRSTAARWIEAARNQVITGTQRELMRHLRITRSELGSIVRLIASQLDLSLPPLLK